MELAKLICSGACLLIGVAIMVIATFGVNKYHHALNRMHAEALGDTLGILFVILGLIIWRGFSFASLKLVCIILFFWLTSPVASHMISRLEIETDEELGEIEVEKR